MFKVIGILSILYSPLAFAGGPIRCVDPTGTVTTVALSPDGKVAVGGGSNDGNVHVWDASNGSELRQLPCYEPDSKEKVRGISAVAFTPAIAFGADAGDWIAAAAIGKPIVFWNRMGDKWSDFIPTEGATSFAFSVDGSQVVVGQSFDITVWAVRGHRKLQVFPLDKREIGLPMSVAFSPDGTMVAAALRENGMKPGSKTPLARVWDVSSGKEIFTAWSHYHPAMSVAFSPNGKLLAIGGSNGERGGLLEIWDMRAQKLVHSIHADKSGLFSVAFNPAGKTIASGGSEPEVKLWDIESGQLVGLLTGHADQIHSLSFSKDGKKLASAGAADKTVLIWSLETDVTKPEQNAVLP